MRKEQEKKSPPKTALQLMSASKANFPAPCSSPLPTFRELGATLYGASKVTILKADETQASCQLYSPGQTGRKRDTDSPHTGCLYI